MRCMTSSCRRGRTRFSPLSHPDRHLLCCAALARCARCALLARARRQGSTARARGAIARAPLGRKVGTCAARAHARAHWRQRGCGRGTAAVGLCLVLWQLERFWRVLAQRMNGQRHHAERPACAKASKDSLCFTRASRLLWLFRIVSDNDDWCGVRTAGMVVGPLLYRSSGHTRQVPGVCTGIAARRRGGPVCLAWSGAAGSYG